MSGYFGFVAADAISLISQPAPLIIGSLILQGYEVPSHITIGGSQAVTMHKLPGGGRIIDAMGPDDGAVAWRGLFAGPDAAQRARSLDVMRIQGRPQVLSFGDYAFNVVIVHFQYDYQERGTIINYRIKTEIILDPFSLATASPEIDLALQDDLNTGQALITATAAAALTYATLVGKSDAAQITASAYNLTTIAAGIGATVVAVAATTSSELASDVTVQAGLQGIGTAVQGSIQGFFAPVSAKMSPDESIITAPALAVATAQAASLAALVQAGGYINRAGANLASSNAQALTPLVYA